MLIMYKNLENGYPKVFMFDLNILKVTNCVWLCCLAVPRPPTDREIILCSAVDREK